MPTKWLRKFTKQVGTGLPTRPPPHRASLLVIIYFINSKYRRQGAPTDWVLQRLSSVHGGLYNLGASKVGFARAVGNGRLGREKRPLFTTHRPSGRRTRVRFMGRHLTVKSTDSLHFASWASFQGTRNSFCRTAGSV